MSPSEDPVTTSATAPRSKGAVVIAVAALIVSVAALGLAAWAALAPEPVETVAYTDAQQQDAKAAICAATQLVQKGVSLNTEAQSDDVPGAMAIAANSRVALLGGGQYLIERLSPATPPQLASDVREFAGTLMDIGAASAAGALNTDPDQAARLSAADALSKKLTEACA
jgi:hypothetical protein